MERDILQYDKGAPATLWFFDRQKKNKDEILFIDARNIFTVIDRAHVKFSDEQIKNLGIITRLYEGKSEEFTALVDEYKANVENAENEADKKYWQDNINWLTERFPEGKYCDVIGLCKVARIEGEDGIAEQDYSLNPGRYVGVVIEEDGMTKEEFNIVMLRLNEELTGLNTSAQELERKITENLLSLVKN